MRTFLQEKLHMSFREVRVFERIPEVLRALPAAIKTPAKFTALLLAVMQMLCMLVFDTPVKPFGQEINYDEWELVWSDEFEGDFLNESNWTQHYPMVRRGGYWDKSQTSMRDGSFIISTEYLEDGRSGAGWYSQCVDTHNKYEFTYGYVECRCICPPASGIWAAFWLLGDGMFTAPTGSAANGCEIDLFESGSYGKANPLKRDWVNQATGYDGYGEQSKGVIIGRYKGENIYSEYNTYGLEWNEQEIIFYINGVETDRLTGEWVPQSPMYLLLSVEVAGTDGTPEKGLGGEEIEFLKDSKSVLDNDSSAFPADFIVDYVRVYNKKV